MIDKNLLRLLGSNKKYIFYAVGLMVLGLFANVGITASICWAINLAIHYDEYSGGAIIFLWPAVCAVIGIAIRYTASRLVGDLKDLLGRKAKKDLRERVYNKIVRLGVRSTDGMSMAGLTQVSMEGVEQLDLYYSSYIPQFFYAMLAPFVLFGITVWIEWRVTLVLLLCVLVPLIGIMFGNIIGGVTNFIAWQFEINQQLSTYFSGSFALIIKGKYELVWLVVPLVILAFIYANHFNIVGMGQDFSKNLGVNYNFILILGLSIASVITASIIVIVGQICSSWRSSRLLRLCFIC